MKKSYVVRVLSKSNPNLCEYSHTNNVQQRIQRLTDNILAAKGLRPQSLNFERFAKFKDVPVEDIGFELYTKKLDLPFKESV